VVTTHGDTPCNDYSDGASPMTTNMARVLSSVHNTCSCIYALHMVSWISAQQYIICHMCHASTFGFSSCVVHVHSLNWYDCSLKSQVVFLQYIIISHSGCPANCPALMYLCVNTPLTSKSGVGTITTIWLLKIRLDFIYYSWALPR